MATTSYSAAVNLSLPQAAARLGVSKHTLRAWAKYQRRVAYIRAGRRLLFRPSDLEEFESRCRVEALRAPCPQTGK